MSWPFAEDILLRHRLDDPAPLLLQPRASPVVTFTLLGSAEMPLLAVVLHAKRSSSTLRDRSSTTAHRGRSTSIWGSGGGIDPAVHPSEAGDGLARRLGAGVRKWRERSQLDDTTHPAKSMALRPRARCLSKAPNLSIASSAAKARSGESSLPEVTSRAKRRRDRDPKDLHDVSGAQEALPAVGDPVAKPRATTVHEDRDRQELRDGRWAPGSFLRRAANRPCDRSPPRPSGTTSRSASARSSIESEPPAPATYTPFEHAAQIALSTQPSPSRGVPVRADRAACAVNGRSSGNGKPFVEQRLTDFEKRAQHGQSMHTRLVRAFVIHRLA